MAGEGPPQGSGFALEWQIVVYCAFGFVTDCRWRRRLRRRALGLLWHRSDLSETDRGTLIIAKDSLVPKLNKTKRIGGRTCENLPLSHIRCKRAGKRYSTFPACVIADGLNESVYVNRSTRF